MNKSLYVVYNQISCEQYFFYLIKMFGRQIKFIYLYIMFCIRLMKFQLVFVDFFFGGGGGRYFNVFQGNKYIILNRCISLLIFFFYINNIFFLFIEKVKKQKKEFGELFVDYLMILYGFLFFYFFNLESFYYGFV